MLIYFWSDVLAASIPQKFLNQMCAMLSVKSIIMQSAFSILLYNVYLDNIDTELH